MTLEIEIEWLDAPGVRSAPLAGSWARLKITAGDQVVTRFCSQRARSVLDAVYTSTFPLTRWVLENWWSLLYESIPDPNALRGLLATPPEHRDWLQRHCPLFSREGMSYPDVCLFRAEDAIGIKWTATPSGFPIPGRFLESGAILSDPENVISALDRLVEATLLRLDQSEDPEVAEARELWAAIKSSRHHEPRLCQRLAALGLDPYADDLDADLVDLLDGLELPDAEVIDLLLAAQDRPVDPEIQTLRALHDALPTSANAPNPRHASLALARLALPYEAGYARARAFRDRLGIGHDDSIRDLEEVAEKALGAPMACEWLAPRDSAIDALVHNNGVLRLAGLQRGVQNRRFLLARALHHGEFATTSDSPSRLLTRGHDWLQAASRAFAAEILAPAAALAARLDKSSSWEDEDALAAEFDVSSMVIAHQLQNHGLLSG